MAKRPDMMMTATGKPRVIAQGQRMKVYDLLPKLLPYWLLSSLPQPYQTPQTPSRQSERADDLGVTFNRVHVTFLCHTVRSIPAGVRDAFADANPGILLAYPEPCEMGGGEKYDKHQTAREKRMTTLMRQGGQQIRGAGPGTTAG